jgi:two-component system, cell cycle sensor histidine kinase and response regulator CckA
MDYSDMTREELLAELENKSVNEAEYPSSINAALFDLLPYGGELINTEGKILNCSPSTARMLGYSVSELVGMQITTLLDPHSRLIFKQKFPDLVRGQPQTAEIRMVCKNGRKLDVLRSATPIINDAGSVEAVLAINIDISERKRAQVKLAESEGQFRSVLQSIKDLVIVVDLDGVFISCYAPTEDLYTRPEAFLGKKHSEVVPNHVDLLFREGMKKIKRGESAEYEYHLEMADGRQWFAMKLSPMSQGDVLVGAVAVVRDVTERKQAEKVLLKTSRMEATSTLAAGIAHDFNNLMVVVLGYSDLLKIQYVAEPDAIDMLDAIGLNARKAGELAQQLLAFARGGNYQPKLMNMNDTIGESLRMNERSFPPRVQIERDLDPELLNISADPTQMNQIVMNLCINAVEAIEKNGRVLLTTRNIQVDVDFAEMHPGLKKGRYIYFSIEDTGCGMSDKVLARIFEPFYSTKFQGRGLGLAAVYGIIKNHSGHISAYSEEGKGTAFKIYLPAVVAEIPSKIKTRKSELSGEETILVVDDEQTVLDVTQRILENYGYSVLLASNGQEAIDLAKSFDGTIHLALLDMGMPVLGGSDAYPLIKKIRQDISVIICSGYEKDMAAQALLDLGANSFLQKPFRAQALLEHIRVVFDGAEKNDV